MPYVNRFVREYLDGGGTPRNAGELNYLLTKTCLRYLEHGALHNDYQARNDIVGALESAKLEFYRRSVAPYEQIKIHENGDVYPEIKWTPSRISLYDGLDRSDGGPSDR